MRTYSLLGVVAWVFGVTILFLTFGVQPSRAAASERENLLNTVIADVQQNYFDAKFNGQDLNKLADAYRQKVAAASTDEQAYELINQMLAKLGDSDTYVVPPKVAQAVADRRASAGLHIVGVGALLSQMSDGEVIVRRVIAGGPAAKGGLRAGDRIATVDGDSITGKKLAQVTDKIKGPRGTPVKLGILAPDGTARTLALTREPVSFPGKVQSKRLPGDIGYIWIPNYEQGTENDVLAALRKLHDCKGLILDMRESFGAGDDATALRIAGLFTENKLGALVTRSGGYWLQPVTSWTPPNFLAGLLNPPPTALDRYTKPPLVVLIDDTSALEIIAAGLRSAGRATLVGRPKTQITGSQQQSFDLPGGGRLWVTTAHYVTADGQALFGGLLPDVLVPFDEAYLRGWAAGTDPDVSRAEAVIESKLHAPPAKS